MPFGIPCCVCWGEGQHAGWDNVPSGILCRVGITCRVGYHGARGLQVGRTARVVGAAA